MLFDAHCHLNSFSKEKAAKVIGAASDQYCFVDSSIGPDSSRVSLEVSARYDNVYTSLGFHPFSARDYSPRVSGEYQRLIDSNKKIIAIGEVGLDYKADTSLAEQEKIVREFFMLGAKNDLPVVIHNRLEPKEGREDTRILDIIGETIPGYSRIILHCFSYSPDFLQKAIKLGIFISFSLNILRGNKRIISSLKECPLDRIILETDSPYMKVDSRLSTPLDIVKVYEYATAVKGENRESFSLTIKRNMTCVFSAIKNHDEVKG